MPVNASDHTKVASKTSPTAFNYGPRLALTMFLPINPVLYGPVPATVGQLWPRRGA